jgi:hypothetical protein
MSKLHYSTVLFFIVLIQTSFHGGATIGQEVDAFVILRKIADNMKVTDHIQYEVKMSHSYHVPATKTNVLPHQRIEAVVKRDGEHFVVTGVEKQYNDGKFMAENKIHHLSTPDFGVYVTGGTHSAGMVTMKQIDRLLDPVLCGGQFGFELDGYLCEGVRFSDLMLIEFGKVRYVGEKEIDGVICQQIDADTEHGFFSVYVDSKNNYAIRKATCEKSFVKDTTTPTESFTSVLDNVEFNLKAGINIPAKGSIQVIRKDKDGHTCMSKNEFERTNININPTFDDNTFSAEFLKGEVINNIDDNESGVVYMWDGEKAVPAYTMLEGTAVMQGYAGYAKLFSMLLGIVLIAIALYRMLRRRKNHEK